MSTATYSHKNFGTPIQVSKKWQTLQRHLTHTGVEHYSKPSLKHIVIDTRNNKLKGILHCPRKSNLPQVGGVRQIKEDIQPSNLRLSIQLNTNSKGLRKMQQLVSANVRKSKCKKKLVEHSKNAISQLQHK